MKYAWFSFIILWCSAWAFALGHAVGSHHEPATAAITACDCCCPDTCTCAPGDCQCAACRP